MKSLHIGKVRFTACSYWEGYFWFALSGFHDGRGLRGIFMEVLGYRGEIVWRESELYDEVENFV